MTIRAWHVVLPLTLLVWVVSTWGMARRLPARGVTNPLKGLGEEQAPRLDEGAGEPAPR